MTLLLIPGINNTPATFAPMIAAMPEGVACLALECPALPDRKSTRLNSSH